MNQIEKLQHLKSILAKVPYELFDLDSWRDLDGLNLCTHKQMIDRAASGCVMGWAAADETFQKLNFNFVRELPVYVPYHPFGVELLAQGVTTGFEYYQATDAVMAFFGLDEDQADFLIATNQYETHSIEEAIHKVDVLIKQLDCKPYELIHLCDTSHLVLDSELREFYLDCDAIREISVVVDCTNKYFPKGCYLEFIAILNVPAEIEPIKYIEENYSVTSPLSFVPNPNEGLEEYLESNPILNLNEKWQEDFVSPYDVDFNARLTHVVMESISNAKIV